MKGLWALTWLEFKVFLREPMGAISALIFPVLIFLVLGSFPSVMSDHGENSWGRIQIPLPVLAILFIGISNVTSLITIISIYREGGILKRLRATPLRPYTILSAHVIVKLVITAISLSLLVLVGKSYGALEPNLNVFSFALALILSFTSLMSIGFVIASMVPTARFAQPFASFILMPMLAFSPVFIPMDQVGSSAFLAFINLMPVTHAVNLLEGIWVGESWFEQFPAVIGLSMTFLFCVAVSTKVFRWE